jgi:hypothetical protein
VIYCLAFSCIKHLFKTVVYVTKRMPLSISQYFNLLFSQSHKRVHMHSASCDSTSEDKYVVVNVFIHMPGSNKTVHNSVYLRYITLFSCELLVLIEHKFYNELFVFILLEDQMFLFLTF